MQSDCWKPDLKYTKVQGSYPLYRSTSVSVCKSACAMNEECEAFIIYPNYRLSGDNLYCYLIKTNNMFDECNWSGAGVYNVYEKPGFIQFSIYKFMIQQI